MGPAGERGRRPARVRSKDAHGSWPADLLRGRMGHLGRRHARDVPPVAAAPPRGRAARGRGRADQGRSRPQQGDGGAAADRPRAARFPDAQHLRDLCSGRRGGAPGSQARRGSVAGAAGDPGGGRGRRAGTPHDAQRAAQARGRRLQRSRPAGQPGGTRAHRRAPGDGDRDRRPAGASARRGPGRLPDRAGSAHQREPSRRPGLRVGSPALPARRPIGPGRRRRRGHHQHWPPADRSRSGPRRHAGTGDRARRPAPGRTAGWRRLRVHAEFPARTPS